MIFAQRERRTRIENINGTLWAIMSCHHNKHIEDVARISEFGEEQSRYIECGMYGNWQVLLPGESYTDKYSYTYTGYKQPFSKAFQSIQGLFDTQLLSQKDFAIILEKYPEYKWVMAKANFTASETMKIIDIWRNNAKMVETLLSMKCRHIVLNRNFYTAKNQKELLKYISQHPEHKFENLEIIRMAIKYGVSVHEIHDYKDSCWRGHHVSFEEYRYLLNSEKTKEMRISDAINIYIDFIAMAEKAGHDIKDPYWHFPKDLIKQHKKVERECKAIEKAHQAILKEQAAKEKAEKEKARRSIYEKFVSMMKPMDGMATENGKFTAFIPQSVEAVEIQAKKLHQCLIANEYIQSVVNKKCILVFIAKAGKPFATAELQIYGNKYRLNQFYGNQGSGDWNAKPEAHETLNLFIEKNNLKMVKRKAT